MFDFTRVTEQASESIDEFFDPNNFGEEKKQTLTTMTSLIGLLRSNVVGPHLWASTSHFALSMQIEDDTNSARLVSIRTSHEQVWVSYGMVLASPFPSGAWITGTTINLNEAAVMIVKAINISIDQRNLNIDHLTYVNEEPEMESSSEVFCYCPHCRIQFYFTDTSAWDGKQHHFCGQRLRLLNE